MTTVVSYCPILSPHSHCHTVLHRYAFPKQGPPFLTTLHETLKSLFTCSAVLLSQEEHHSSYFSRPFIPCTVTFELELRRADRFCLFLHWFTHSPVFRGLWSHFCTPGTSCRAAHVREEHSSGFSAVCQGVLGGNPLIIR